MSVDNSMDIRIADLKEPGFFNGTIHCRVTCKRPMRTFDQGQVISVDLKDKSGEIRAVAFHDEATRMERLLRLDRVYRIKTFKLQTKRHQYSQSPHDLEIVFEARSVVTHMPDVVSFPRKKYHFVPLRSVLGRELESFVDVIGVVVDTGELKECTHEDGKTSDMRYVTLADQSDLKIKARLWGGLARDFDGSDHPVLAFGNVTIMISSPDPNADTPGLSRFLDAKVQTSILENPDDFPETTTLREWFSGDKDDSEMDVSNTSTSVSDVEDIRRIIKDSPRTRKRGVVERIHSEPSHSKTRVPQPKRSATDPSQAQRLSKRESAKALRTLPLEKDLREISDNCGDSWKRLLTYVGLKSTKIQEFKNDENTLPDACFQGLVHWLGGNVDDSDPVNWSTLLTAMKKAEMAGNGREWKQKIVERCTASLDKPIGMLGSLGLNDETSTPRPKEAN